LHILLEAGGFDVRRAFAPAPDLDDLLRRRGRPWVDLERGDPVAGSRVVGFGVPCESLLTNVLRLLGLMGLPLRAAERIGEDLPIVLLGGGGLSNPLPASPFADAVFLGEAEEAAPDLFSALAGEGSRGERLRRAAAIPGVWIPSLGKPRVEFRRIDALHRRWAPVRQLVPLSRIAQDRAVVEVARGCTRGCRFCQASFLARPVRERPPAETASLLDDALACTGWEEGGLLSLSLSDHSGLEELLARTAGIGAARRAEIGKPSLRPDTLIRMRGEPVKGRLTIAPEAGSGSLRMRLNKDISDGEIVEAADAAFRMGATGLKLYFLIGLPGETEEDVRALAALVLRIAETARKRRRKPAKSITVALSPFVPKAHTPLQWAPMMPEEELWRRIGLVRELCGRTVSVSWNSPRVALVEAVLGLGDDGPAADLLERAVLEGACFDAWTDRFRWDVWERLLRESPGCLGTVLSGRDPERPLPWEFIGTGPSRSFLLREWERYRLGTVTPDCREAGCSGCGACAEPVPPSPAEPRRPPGGDAPVPSPADGGGVLRVRYSKTGLARFSSHLDVVRLWGRVIRRSGLPVAWSRGYVNRPRLQFGPPLPLGMESTAEYVDIHLTASPGPDPVGVLSDCLPAGFRVIGTRMLAAGDPPPTRGIAALGYRVHPGPGGWACGSAAGVAAGLAGLGQVLSASPEEDGSLRLVTGCGGRETRPDLVLSEASDGPVRVCRTEVYRRVGDGLQPLSGPHATGVDGA